jgi:hypothetical protein
LKLVKKILWIWRSRIIWNLDFQTSVCSCETLSLKMNHCFSSPLPPSKTMTPNSLFQNQNMPAYIKVLLLKKCKYIFSTLYYMEQCHTPPATNVETKMWTVTKCIHIIFIIYPCMCPIVCSQTNVLKKIFQETLVKPHNKSFTCALYLHANSSPCSTVLWLS